jgi:hypothetical protein
VAHSRNAHTAVCNTVRAAPDAPVSYFALRLFGKDKALIVNSRNVCAGENRAAVALGAHNGKRRTLHPRIVNRRCKKSRGAGRKRAGHRRGAGQRRGTGAG